MKINTILLVLILGGIILAAGCTIRSGTPVPVPETTPMTTDIPAPATAAVTASPTTFSPDWPSAPLAGEYTTVPTTRPAPDNPYLEELSVRKRTFINPLPNCFMEHAFPAIATDPGYGIRQVNPRLATISEHDYEDFLEEYTEGEAENTALKTPAVCQNTGNEPTWNFIEIRVILVPTNFFASDYTITGNVLSDGKIVAQFETTERLVIDEKIVRTVYVPIHASEVDLFDSVDMTFTRH